MKERLIRIVLILLVVCSMLSCNTAVITYPQHSNQPANQAIVQPIIDQKVLILYDYVDDELGWVGEIHATFLANLLGHFPILYDAKDVADYKKGEIETYKVTFYLGSYYDNPDLSQAFISDVMSTDKTIVWFNYNIWQIAWDISYDFAGKFGFDFNRHDTSGYSTVYYKGETFSKDSDNPDIGLTTVLDNRKVVTVATASNGANIVPYILKSGNFWYVADMPFVYPSEESSYLVFCDVLYDMLGIIHAPSHRALVRIEDVNPTSNPQQLIAIADYLYSQGIPFAVALIPLYTDPLGGYKVKAIMSCLDNEPRSLTLSTYPEVVKALQYMVSKGGTIVMHGYSHQYDSVANPYNGVSGTDFEFYRVIENPDGGMPTYIGPVPEDSPNWAQQRISRGISEIEKAKLSAELFEVPHYAASAVDYRVFAANFLATYHHVIYCPGSLNPNKGDILGTLGDEIKTTLPMKPSSHDQLNQAAVDGLKPTKEAARSLEQFFPYVIQRDVYGQKVLPENLSNIKVESWKGLETRLPEDIIRAAKKNLVIRDSWASFYFHPFINIEYLKQTVEGIKGLGYTFVAPSPTIK